MRTCNFEAGSKTFLSFASVAAMCFFALVPGTRAGAVRNQRYLLGITRTRQNISVTRKNPQGRALPERKKRRRRAAHPARRVQMKIKKHRTSGSRRETAQTRHSPASRAPAGPAVSKGNSTKALGYVRLLPERKRQTAERKTGASRNSALHAPGAAETALVANERLKKGRRRTAGREARHGNAGLPSVRTGIAFRYKSGDEGLSRFDEISVPLAFRYPGPSSDQWIFAFNQAYLYSASPGSSTLGNKRSGPYMGSAYLFTGGGARVNTPVSSLRIFRPEIGYSKEGRTTFASRLGLSPLGGPVHPLPTFSLTAARTNWHVNVHQRPVKESILSFTGQKDPYSGLDWGRVLRTGVDARMSFSLPGSCWVSIGGGYDYLWGENVWSNGFISGTASFGRTMNSGRGQLVYGVFSTLKHFTHNTDFFTFGHGGYFSPQFLFMAGPILRYTLRPGSASAFDVSLSADYIHYRDAPSPHYPLGASGTVLPSSPAFGDFTGFYPGDSAYKFGGSIGLRLKKMLAPKIEGLVWFRGNLSAGYDEAQTGALVRIPVTF